MSDLFSVKGRVALVTGASRGLGKVFAKTLAEHGATVVLSSRRESDLQAVKDEIVKAGGKADIAAFDVQDEARAVAAIKAIPQKHGRLDILINNAGILRRDMLLDTPTEEFRNVIETNLTGAFVVAREAGRIMQAQNYGRIVNIASVMSILGRASVGPYVSSKHAIVGLTKTLAAELGPNVTVNSIAPGYMITDITEALQKNVEFSAMLEKRTAARRWGKPEDLSGALMLLASDASSYITGHTLVVDGGLTSVLAGA
ncbi:MAG: family oxidoreductase [Alphaproteobacteria bacterium]|nr:family oxidoreductase [Alphaproteobacteria bacterium]